MRALGCHRRQRRADLERLTEVEAGLAEVVRMTGPLPSNLLCVGSGAADRARQQQPSECCPE